MAHTRLRIGAPLVVALAVAGCAAAPKPGPPIPHVLEQVSRAGALKSGEIIEQTLKEQETFGYVSPFAPVVLPPEIRRIWVLTHVGEDGNLVSGHWVYMRLHDWRWFIEAEATPLRLGSVPAAPAIAPMAPPPPPAAWQPAPSRSSQLPWVEGSPAEGTPAPSGASAGLEGGSVPTQPIPAPQLAPRPGGPGQ